VYIAKQFDITQRCGKVVDEKVDEIELTSVCWFFVILKPILIEAYEKKII
jgi:hypothetical protein